MASSTASGPQPAWASSWRAPEPSAPTRAGGTSACGCSSISSRAPCVTVFVSSGRSPTAKRSGARCGSMSSRLSCSDYGARGRSAPIRQPRSSASSVMPRTIPRPKSISATSGSRSTSIRSSRSKRSRSLLVSSRAAQPSPRARGHHMAFNIGVNVVEVDGRATPTIVGAPISNAGFLVNSQRGVPNRPVRMGGMADYMSHFGGYTTAYGAHALRGFFENGGSTAYVVRVAGNATTPAAAASVTLPHRLRANTLTISAGSDGRADPGRWGNSLAVAVVDHARASSLTPAQVLATVSEPFALTSGQVLAVAVNGAPPVSVTLNSIDFANIAAATAAEVAATINRQVSTMRAGVSTDRKVLLASGTPGPSSRLAVSGTAATPLGFTGASTNSDGSLAAGSTTAALAAVAGVEAGSALRFEVRGHVVAPNPMAAAFTAGSGINVAVDGGAPVLVSFQASDFVNGVGAITPGEVVAAINRQATGFRAALTSDNRLALLSNSYGPSSSVAVTAPASDATAALGLAGSAPVNGSRQFIALTWVSERYRIVAWNGAFSAVPALAGRIQSAEFDLVIRQSGVEVERFESLSMQTGLGTFAPTVVNDQSSGSSFITAAPLANAAGPGRN